MHPAGERRPARAVRPVAAVMEPPARVSRSAQETAALPGAAVLERSAPVSAWASAEEARPAAAAREPRGVARATAAVAAEGES